MSTQIERSAPPSEIVPKPGYLTTAFMIWLATFIGGGIITFAVRKGLPQDVADSNRAIIIEAVRELLPLAWLGLSTWLGNTVAKGRRAVTEAKSRALEAWAMQAAPPMIVTPPDDKGAGV